MQWSTTILRASKSLLTFSSFISHLISMLLKFPRGACFLHSTGRCGSTLVNAALHKLPGIFALQVGTLLHPPGSSLVNLTSENKEPDSLCNALGLRPLPPSKKGNDQTHPEENKRRKRLSDTIMKVVLEEVWQDGRAPKLHFRFPFGHKWGRFEQIIPISVL